MIRSIFFNQDEQVFKDIDNHKMNEAIKDNQGLLWVSIENPDPVDYVVLSEVFHFHPLAIEDCQTESYQPPKVDDFSDYLFIIAHAIQLDKTDDNLLTQELNVFLGSNYLVTCFHGSQPSPVDRVRQRLNRDSRLLTNGPDFLCHAILDDMVDNILPLLDEMDEEIELLEGIVISEPTPPTLEKILSLKHRIMTLRRIIAPQREVVNRLSRDEFSQIDIQSRIYYRDIYDHLVRILDMSESIRDIASSAMDIYLSSTSLKLNEIMKALTVVSTIFLPLSFIAGVYGMNFVHMPELSWKYGYALAWLIFISVGGGMLFFFSRRKWF